MKKFFSQSVISVIIILSVLTVDQIIKILVKTHMYLHDCYRITDWFYIYFTENNGMAFGMEIVGKLFLTTFRIAAVIGIAYYMHKMIKKNVKTGYIVCLSFILAGAAGNILDSVFYGEVFSESSHMAIANFVPFGQGYSSWLHGKVVDMFYFPIIDTYWPSWIPFVGGEHFIFFSPIFNFADASISCGIITVLLFYRTYLNTEKKETEENTKQK